MRAFVLAALLPNVASGMVQEDPPVFDPYFVASGRKFSFVVDNHSVWGTGSNKYGQLGIGSFVDQDTLVDVSMGVSAIAAGAFHSLFVKEEDGSLWVAGSNHYGQLGVLGPDTRSTPVKVELPPPGIRVVSVAAGYGHSLAVTSDENGTKYVLATGRAWEGQLGEGSTVPRDQWRHVEIGEDEDVVKVAAGYDFSYFLTAGGDVWASGQNLGGQLGDGTCLSKLSAVKVLTGVKDMAAGESHGLFLMNDGRVLSTGANHDGQLGLGTREKHCSPSSGTTMDNQKVAAGGDSSCFAIGDDYKLSCSGSNRDGQLGLGEEPTKTTPTLVPGVHRHVESISVSDSHSLFLAHPGDVFVAGTNDYGELGLGNISATDTATFLTKLGLPSTTRSTTTLTTITTIMTTTVVDETTRLISGDDDAGYMVWVAIMIGGVVLLISCGIFCFPPKAGEPNAEGAPQGEDQQRDLELMRAEMSS